MTIWPWYLGVILLIVVWVFAYFSGRRSACNVVRKSAESLIPLATNDEERQRYEKMAIEKIELF